MVFFLCLLLKEGCDSLAVFYEIKQLKTNSVIEYLKKKRRRILQYNMGFSSQPLAHNWCIKDNGMWGKVHIYIQTHTHTYTYRTEG